MSMISWTDIQLKRLKELNAGLESMSASFDTNQERNQSYQTLSAQIYFLMKEKKQ